MSKPVIGIVTGLKSENADLRRYCKVAGANYSYVLAVLGSGGIPLLLPPMERDADVSEAVEKIDGLLVTGGNDVNPLLFGEEPIHGMGSFSPERDHIDLCSIRCAFEKKKPILGICRGIQSINIAFEGTMYQDINTDEFFVKHSQQSESFAASHTVEVCKESLLFPILGEKAAVNSWHHQAIKDPAPGFLAGAVAKDGIIEEIERTDGRFVLGLQWHPELMAAEGDEKMQKIFSLFVAACNK